MKTVFLAASGSIVKWAYTDVINSPDIEYCDYPYDFKSGIKKYIFTRTVAKYTPFFAKKLLYKKYLRYNFLSTAKPEDDMLFIFTCQYNMFFDTFFFSFIHFLKKLCPKSKYAFYYNDIIETCYPECIDTIKKEFDLVLTFDKADAEKYNLAYYGEIYSKNKIDGDCGIKPFDIFFVGSDRKRFDTVLQLFKTLSDIGLKAVFYLFDILPENKNRLSDYLPDTDTSGDAVKYKDSVLYKNVYCPYQKTLSLIDKCNCILEITLSAQNAATLRLLEATVYGKKLITNCRDAENKPYYNKNNFFFFDNVKSISQKDIADFLSKPIMKTNYDFSPLKMIEYIKEELYKEG